MNQVTIMGNLVRDAELKYTNSGLGIITFTIAVNESKKVNGQWVQGEASFFDVSMWENESNQGIAAVLKKGKSIVVNGKLRQERWQSDGQQRSKVKIMANGVMIPMRKKKAETNQTVNQPQPAQVLQPQQTTPSQPHTLPKPASQLTQTVQPQVTQGAPFQDDIPLQTVQPQVTQGAPFQDDIPF